MISSSRGGNFWISSHVARILRLSLITALLIDSPFALGDPDPKTGSNAANGKPILSFGPK